MLNDIPKHLQLFADQAKDIGIVFLDADGDIVGDPVHDHLPARAPPALL